MANKAPIVKPVVEKPPMRAFGIWRDIGQKEYRLSDMPTSVKYLDDANRVEPENAEALICRSKAKMRLMHFAEALADVDKAISIVPLNKQALYQKAETYFEMGEFEKALVMFHQGYKKRKSFGPFVQVAEETIEDCIGRNVGPVMADCLDVIREMESKSKKPQGRTSSVMQNLRARSDRQNDILFAKKYLGRMWHDKVFLERLRVHPALESPNRAGVQKLRKYANTAYDYLRYTQEALRARRPFYTLKYHEATLSETLKRRQEMASQARMKALRDKAKGFLDKMRELRTQRDFKKFIELAERTLHFLHSKSKTQLSGKDSFLSAAFNIIALGYLDQKMLEKGCSDREHVRQVYLYFDLPVVGDEPLDSLFMKTTVPFRDYRKVIRQSYKWLKLTEDQLEQAFLYHEISLAYLTLNKLDNARSAGRKCLHNADDVKNLAWHLNALMLLARIEMAAPSRVDAKTYLDDARDVALKFKNDKVIKFVDMCSRVLDEVDLDAMQQSQTLLSEKRIIDVIDKNMETDALLLFRRIQSQPPNARMSLVPGQSQSRNSTTSRRPKMSTYSETARRKSRITQ